MAGINGDPPVDQVLAERADPRNPYFRDQTIR